MGRKAGNENFPFLTISLLCTCVISFAWSFYVFLHFLHVVKIFFCDIAAERTGDGAGDGQATPENRVYKLRFPLLKTIAGSVY